MAHDVATAQLDGEVAVEAAAVHDVSLDDVAAVAQRDHEFVESVMRVVLHDVPKQRSPADFDHRLGLDIRLFRKAGAPTAGEDDNFHESTLRSERGLWDEPLVQGRRTGGNPVFSPSPNKTGPAPNDLIDHRVPCLNRYKLTSDNHLRITSRSWPAPA